MGWDPQWPCAPSESLSQMVWPCRQNVRRSTTETATVRSTESRQVGSWGGGQLKRFKDYLKGLDINLTPASRLLWTTQPVIAASQRVLLHQRRDAQQKLRESELQARLELPSPALQYPPIYVPPVGAPFGPGSASPATSGPTLTDLPPNTDVEVIFESEGRTLKEGSLYTICISLSYSLHSGNIPLLPIVN